MLRGTKNANFEPNWVFPDLNSSWNFTDGYTIMQKLEVA